MHAAGALFLDRRTFDVKKQPRHQTSDRFNVTQTESVGKVNGMLFAGKKSYRFGTSREKHNQDSTFHLHAPATNRTLEQDTFFVDVGCPVVSSFFPLRTNKIRATQESLLTTSTCIVSLDWTPRPLSLATYRRLLSGIPRSRTQLRSHADQMISGAGAWYQGLR